MTIELTVNIITILVLFILGLFTLFKNRKSATHLLFTILTIILIAWTVTNYLSLHNSTESGTLFWIRWVMFVTSFMGPTLLFLIYTFPNEKFAISVKYQLLIFVLMGFSACLALSPWMFIKVLFLPGRGAQPVPGPGIIVFILNFFLSVVASFIITIKRYLKARGLEKAQLLYLIFGLVVTFTLHAFTNFIFVNLFKITAGVTYGPMFNLFMAGFIFYAIVKHRLFDIRLVVARSISYSLLLFLLAGFYIFSLFSISQIFYKVELRGTQVIINVALSLIVAFTFQPLRKFLEKVTDKFFFKDLYDTDNLLTNLTKIMSSTLLIQPLIENVLKKIVNEVKIKKAAIIHWENQQGKKYFYPSNEEKDKLNHDQIKILIESKSQPVIFDEIHEGERKKALRASDYFFSYVLQVKNKILGILLLGEKLSGDIFSSQDIELLQILAPQLSVAINNALAYQKIQKFSETLKLEVNRATQDLQITNKRLKEVSDLKDEFVSLTSHELRTPLSAISGSMSTILEGFAGKINPKAKEFLEGAYNENQRLVRLVNNLLNISRIEAKRLKYTITTFDLFEVVKEVMESFKNQALEVKVEILTNLAEKLEVKADQDKVREIFVNLIGNALKFTEKGTVEITAWRDDGFIICAVEDTGRGILPQDQKKLFRKFEQGDGVKRVERKGGTGLGLYICKNLLEGMGGEIWLSSEHGKGSTFYFTIPNS